MFPGYGSNYGQISLYGNSPTHAKIDVTGWTVKANRGSHIVGQAINLYEPVGAQSPGDIFLENGDTLNMYFGSTYIGSNFRMNECIGYLANSINPTPPIYAGCPYIDHSRISSFTGECQNYIFSLGSCQAPAANPPIPANDYACQSFLNTLNYKGCVDEHRTHPDFLGHEWRTWTGGEILDEYHDQVYLFDKNGLLVDYYTH